MNRINKWIVKMWFIVSHEMIFNLSTNNNLWTALRYFHFISHRMTKKWTKIRTFVIFTFFRLFWFVLFFSIFVNFSFWYFTQQMNYFPLMQSFFLNFTPLKFDFYLVNENKSSYREDANKNAHRTEYTISTIIFHMHRKPKKKENNHEERNVPQQFTNWIIERNDVKEKLSFFIHYCGRK